MAEGAEKKHEATPFRRQKAREDGQIPRSQDLASAVLLLVGILVLQYTGPQIFEALASILQDHLEMPFYWDTDVSSILNRLLNVLTKMGFALAPLLGLILLTAIVVNLAQSGIMFLPDKLGFDLNRINPMSGFSRLFSLPNATRLGFGILKMSLVTATLLIGVSNRWEEIQGLYDLSMPTVSRFVWDTSTQLCLQAAVVLVILALADYGFQRWKFEQDLRMTDEEIREELKSTQGDPSLKARRRRVQRELAAQRLKNDVPKADVVVVNPTEIAIAIKYDMETMRAPIVVAKGANQIALRIRQIAAENNIPIVERIPLARALFKSVEVGQPIPVQEYAAVAEVLKYVYQVQGRPLPKQIAA